MSRTHELRWAELRERYEGTAKDAAQLEDGAMSEAKSGEKGDDDSATVAVAYAILAVSARLEAATEAILDVLEQVSERSASADG